MGNLLQYIREEDEMRERFVAQAFSNNPKISDLGEFEDALFSAFATEKGKNASRWFNDEVIMELFDSQETRTKIRMNISDAEFERIYGEDGFKMPPRPEVVVAPQPVTRVKGYSRDGAIVKGYTRTFNNWTKAEARFLRVRKNKKLTPKQTVAEFNEHFKDNPRSASSIKTKMYRL